MDDLIEYLHRRATKQPAQAPAPEVMTGSTRQREGQGCGTCAHFVKCSHVLVRNVKADTKYCAYTKNRYLKNTP